jgi:AcrR family transcriptional regulator
LVTPIDKCENASFLILHWRLTGVKMTGMAQVRPYRGVEAAERLTQRRRQLLEAGLDLLGSDSDGSELTVRTICRQAGLALRYFYESFADKDEFVASVFDWVIGDIAATTQAAVSAAPRKERNRAGMANLVRTIAEDSRIGRFLISSQTNSVLVRKRAETGGLLAMLYGQNVAEALGVQQTELGRATAHFAVGGVVQMVSTWLAGDIDLSHDELVDQLALILDDLVDPKLYRG